MTITKFLCEILIWAHLCRGHVWSDLGNYHNQPVVVGSGGSEKNTITEMYNVTGWEWTWPTSDFPGVREYITLYSMVTTANGLYLFGKLNPISN